MINKLDLKTVDIIKFNHWLNARKITSQFINKKQNSLSKKLKTKKILKLVQKN